MDDTVFVESTLSNVEAYIEATSVDGEIDEALFAKAMQATYKMCDVIAEAIDTITVRSRKSFPSDTICQSTTLTASGLVIHLRVTVIAYANPIVMVGITGNGLLKLSNIFEIIANREAEAGDLRGQVLLDVLTGKYRHSSPPLASRRSASETTDTSPLDDLARRIFGDRLSGSHESMSGEGFVDDDGPLGFRPGGNYVGAAGPLTGLNLAGNYFGTTHFPTGLNDPSAETISMKNSWDKVQDSYGSKVDGPDTADADQPSDSVGQEAGDPATTDATVLTEAAVGDLAET